MKTAYQIADELEERNAPYEDDTANFIRQQQAEIQALKADSARYQWLRAEFAAGRETYLAEGIPNGEELDKYIDRKANK